MNQRSRKMFDALGIGPPVSEQIENPGISSDKTQVQSNQVSQNCDDIINSSENSEMDTFEYSIEDFEAISTIAQSSTHVAQHTIPPKLDVRSTLKSKLQSQVPLFEPELQIPLPEKCNEETFMAQSSPIVDGIKTLEDNQQSDSQESSSSSSSSSSSCNTSSSDGSSSEDSLDDDDADPTFNINTDGYADESSSSNDLTEPDDNAALNSKKSE
ncbi:uncharacterized protein LOC126742493 [Anthonomus grandis grandis]|uniref:uncharacterized protein LOC126742493 n=1 Tax=Anthonomus grandis grandis TaxID=2921223 RepID=UPI00216687C1|nr:uncharacterized protein LOC126742493 [Anthonomus grandis grandis]